MGESDCKSHSGRSRQDSWAGIRRLTRARWDFKPKERPPVIFPGFRYCPLVGYLIRADRTQLGLSSPVQDIILGVIIVAAVTIDQMRQRQATASTNTA